MTNPTDGAMPALPDSYTGGTLTSNPEGASVRLVFSSAADAEAWFEKLCDRHDAALTSNKEQQP